MSQESTTPSVELPRPDPVTIAAIDIWLLNPVTKGFLFSLQQSIFGLEDVPLSSLHDPTNADVTASNVARNLGEIGAMATAFNYFHMLDYQELITHEDKEETDAEV